MQNYHHLTASKRGEIQALKAAGATLKQIADFIGCDTSTVCRELKRNGGKRSYNAERAEQLYHSWEKGAVENYNGLLRQYIPKRRELDSVTDKELKEYQYKINSRPRAKLNFQSPKLVFYHELNKFALVT